MLANWKHYVTYLKDFFSLNKYTIKQTINLIFKQLIKQI